MRDSHLVWSGQVCPFRRAGVYFGLASSNGHFLAARWLLPKRAAVYLGGTVCVRPGEPWPLTYFAIRDPSAVRVVPVREPRAGREPAALGNGFSHVSLIFDFSRTDAPPPLGNKFSPAQMSDLAELASRAEDHQHGVFLVTIGLSVEREGAFHQRAVLSAGGQSYADMCDRISSLKDEFAD